MGIFLLAAIAAAVFIYQSLARLLRRIPNRNEDFDLAFTESGTSVAAEEIKNLPAESWYLSSEIYPPSFESAINR